MKFQHWKEIRKWGLCVIALSLFSFCGEAKKDESALYAVLSLSQKNKSQPTLLMNGLLTSCGTGERLADNGPGTVQPVTYFAWKVLQVNYVPQDYIQLGLCCEVLNSFLQPHPADSVSITQDSASYFRPSRCTQVNGLVNQIDCQKFKAICTCEKDDHVSAPYGVPAGHWYTTSSRGECTAYLHCKGKIYCNGIPTAPPPPNAPPDKDGGS